jgi:hypothetical protein
MTGRFPAATHDALLCRGAHHGIRFGVGLALSRAQAGLAYIVRQREDHWHLRFGALGEKG